MAQKDPKRGSNGKRGGTRKGPPGGKQPARPVRSQPAKAIAPSKPRRSRALPASATTDVPGPRAPLDAALPASAASPDSTSGEVARQPDGFPVVGIGASAGGLEALEEFMRRVPPRSGMAFAVIQHLDPTQKGMLAELLQRSTSMPVVQAKDRMKVEPDHVYVIPPNRDMSLLHGSLRLRPQVAPRGLNLPVDLFFRSLAEDRGERSIGVILSGMGSDGTLGLRAIKEAAGATFVQSLASAKFDSMPRSAIEAGLADVVAPVEELPRKIVAYLRHAPHVGGSTAPHEGQGKDALQRVFVLVRAQTGGDFSLYKRSTIHRRIERRMGLHQIDSLADYVRFLRENPREIELLFKDLLIGVTSFFRDPPAWEYLENVVLPRLIASRPNGSTLRAWVPGCSTGEEAYSLAIVFQEAMEKLRPAKDCTLQIFATDLDRDAIEKARHGFYPRNIAADISPGRLRRFFVEEQNGYRAGKDIRERIVFAPQNVAMDPPFTRVDILSCRNLLIYLSSELQKQLIPVFHYSLRPGGVLILGTAETVGPFTGLFAQLDGKTRIYRRLEQVGSSLPVGFPSSSVRTIASEMVGDTFAREPAAPQNLQTLAERVLVRRFSPVAVLCSERGDVLYISGRAGKYLEPAVGKVSFNVFAMAREGLRYQLSSAFAAAVRESRAVIVRGVKVGTNGGTQAVDLTVEVLSEPSELRGMVMVVISDRPSPAKDAAPGELRGGEARKIGELEEDMRRAREEIQSTREEMQTSQEELRSTNEELQSTNEELQSTNEELTTSKEEMQSMNEELQTVNHELQAKVDELSRANSDMKNLLNSTGIATLFLDGNLRVRRFTSSTARIIRLIPGDAGRPITDLTSNLDYPDLVEDAHEVLRTLAFKEKRVAARDGGSFTVRIMPYRTLDNVIDGLVITFMDASGSRALETTIMEQASELRQVAESLPSLIWSSRADGAWEYLSGQWVAYTGVPEREQLGQRWLEQVHPDDRADVRERWRGAVRAGSPFDCPMRLRRAGGEYRWFQARAVPIRDAAGAVLRWYGNALDIEEARRADAGHGPGLEQLAAVVDGFGEAFVGLDDQLVVRTVNRAAETTFGLARQAVLGRKLVEALPVVRGTAIEERLQQALRDRNPAAFETTLDGAAHGSSFRVRIEPGSGRGGISVFLQGGAAVSQSGGGRASKDEPPGPGGAAP